MRCDAELFLITDVDRGTLAAARAFVQVVEENGNGNCISPSPTLRTGGV